MNREVRGALVKPAGSAQRTPVIPFFPLTAVLREA